MKLEVEKLNLKYPSAEKALSDVSFETGGVLAIVGGEGSGKTSLLRSIAGLERSSGLVLLDGADVAKINAKDRDFQLFFENFTVFNQKTVYKNLAYPLEIRGYKKGEISKTVLDVALKFGLYDVLELKAKKLNEQEKRRVALARLFVRDASVTLLDDVLKHFSGKDLEQAKRGLKELIKTRKGVVLYAASNLSEAFEVADEALVLSGGQVKQQGDMLTLYNNPKWVGVAKAFGDYNAVKTVLTEEDGRLYVLVFGQKILLPFGKEKLLSEDYVGREILVGFHFTDAVAEFVDDTNCDEKTVKISEFLNKKGFFLAKIDTQDEAVYVRSDTKAEGSCRVNVRSDALRLFDVCSEGSILFD